MKRSNKITAAIGALSLVAALSGCSSSQGASSGEVLTMWTFKQSQVEALQALGDEWGAQNDMTVEVSVYTPDATYKTKVQAAAQSNTLPDILSVNSGGLDWAWAQAGITQDITEEFDESWQSQFLPGVVRAATVTASTIENSGDDPATTLKNLEADHSYSVPYLAGTPGVVFASKKALEAAGVDTSNPPATWDEWISDIEKTVANDPTNGGIVTGLKVPETGYLWLYRPLSYAYLGPDGFEGRQSNAQDPSWTSNESVKTLELYDQLTPLWSPGVLNLDIDQADQSFASGKAAWVVGGTYTLSSLTTFGMDASDVMVFPVPSPSGGEISRLSYQAAPLVNGAVTTTSEHKEEAISFLKYITSVEGAELFAKEAQDLPATQISSSALSSELLEQLVGLVTPDESGGEPFNANDRSADPPASNIAHTSAVALANLPAKSAPVSSVASTLADLYEAAWEAAK
ncbi:multiple sugar transport system substrate-binding protein [Arthrobacter pigmenti]|uniref:Multiple sugar transport system substrate-binding protein n=1 Tax=Arthrobacter pigmenti TaxID=271432 RepID=A0A846RWB7_9MICC|nr:extracellular solute-binding protein [Arthrobacter pigmenti]NJC24467.1 multiple sugar transport system substrate-binding protein [Arthrobacter pigmenti]